MKRVAAVLLFLSIATTAAATIGDGLRADSNGVAGPVVQGNSGCCPQGARVPGEIVVLFVTGTTTEQADAVVLALGGTVLFSSGTLYIVRVPVGEEFEYRDLFAADPLVAAADVNAIISCVPGLPDCTCCPTDLLCEEQLTCSLAPVLLAVDKSVENAGDVKLSWSPECDTWGEDYAIYEGTLGDFSSHTAAVCGEDFSTRFTEEITPAPGDRYFLIVPRFDTEEGSYGTDSKGFERPRAVGACVADQLFEECSP